MNNVRLFRVYTHHLDKRREKKRISEIAGACGMQNTLETLKQRRACHSNHHVLITISLSMIYRYPVASSVLVLNVSI
jgi:hypothetical protein